MSLYVLKPGILDTIQDRGRYGYAHLGIHRSGAMDPLAMAVSNALAGNPADEAVLEMHYPAPELRFDADARIALSGGDFSARISGAPVPINTPILVRSGAVLHFGPRIAGARCCLAVHGGFDVASWLDSRSTLRVAGIGGFQGRALQRGDVLALRQKGDISIDLPDSSHRALPWRANTNGLYPADTTIRFCTGPEFDLLKKTALARLGQCNFRIGAQSDRMGYRLEGPTLETRKHAELVSSVVFPGVIQLLPSGQLIVLLADSQTTGGYPRIGSVVQADLPGLAQRHTGEFIRLEMVTQEQAFRALQEQQNRIRQLQWGCILREKYP